MNNTMNKYTLSLLCIFSMAGAGQPETAAKQEQPWYKKHKKALIVTAGVLGVLKAYDWGTQLPDTIKDRKPGREKWFKFVPVRGWGENRYNCESLSFCYLRDPQAGTYNLILPMGGGRHKVGYQPWIHQKLWGHGIELWHLAFPKK
jgi:hypothetical protein